MVSGVQHFADYLKMLPSAWVFRNFIKGDDSARKILSSSMIDSEVRKFSEPEHLRTQFQGLSLADQLTCALVYLCGDAGFRVSSFSGFENSLVKSFLVYAGTNQSREIRLFGFHEFRQSILHQCVSVIADAAVRNDSDEVPSSWKYLCVNDITLIVSLASQRMLKKKKSGSLDRKSSLQIKKVSGSSVPLKQETNDFLNDLLISYCLRRGLVTEAETECLINTEAFLLWLDEPIDDRYKDISDSALNFSGRIWGGLLNELLDRGISLQMGLFPQEMQEYYLNLLTALEFAGLASVMKKGRDVLLCKVNAVSNGADGTLNSVLVMPDYSVVIAQESDPAELYNFMQIGHLTDFDRVYKGVIDKEVFRNSLSRGTQGTQIIEWLQKWNAPSNVIETIREWLREFNRLYITDREILVSSDERVSAQIRGFDLLKGLIEEIPVHAVYLIKKGSEQKVKDILSGIGFDYRMPGQEATEGLSAQELLEKTAVQPRKWVPYIEIAAEESDVQAMRGTKYGNELKELDISEIVHVIDYAILTGQNLSFDYDGSPYLKDGLYAVRPVSCEKGIDPVLEAEIIRTHSHKRFYIKKIRKIGVVSK